MSILATAVDVSDFVSVEVDVSPLAIPYENFGLAIIIGDSGVIDTVERFRQYTSITGVGVDFGNTAPEYLAAQLLFSQEPQPAVVDIGAWARTALAGKIHAATLTASQQLLANFNAITTGAFDISIDGVPHAISGCSFASALNLNGVASLLQAQLPAGVLAIWGANYSRFDIISSTTGLTSSVGFATPPTAIGDFVFSGQPTAATVYATGTFTESASNNALATDTFEIGNNTWTIVAAIASTPGSVLKGANFGATMANLVAAINGAAGSGTTYIPTGVASNCSATFSTTLNITADTIGQPGNSLPTVYTDHGGTSCGSFGAATLTGGDGDTITVNSAVVTFIANGASPVGDQIALGATLLATLAATLTFLNASTDANIAKMTYINDSVSKIYCTSKVTGTAGNAYTLAASSSAISVSGANLVGGSGTDISTLLGLQTADGGYLVPGIAAETPLSALQANALVSTQWYGAMFASSVSPTDADFEAMASYILASTRSRLLGVTVQNTAILNSSIMTDLTSVLQSFNNKRVFTMYSSTNPYACATIFGRTFTVNFNASDSTIMLAYKQAPGLQGENLNEQQFATLKSKGGNINIIVNNGAVMIYPGQMTNGYWFDEVHGVDWLANRIQTDLFNELYQITTKVPQTDSGNHTLVTVMNAALNAAVINGLLAPGPWNAAGFGSLQQGDTLPTGFYVYAPLIATQPESDREERISVPFQVAGKLAGAIQQPQVVLNINR